MPRHPLPWLLALEAIVLVALAFAAWHLLSDRLGSPAASIARLPVSIAAPRRPTPSTSAAPVPKPPAPPARPHPPTPGLSADPAFWSGELSQLNRDETAWEGLEWRVVQTVEAFVRAYVKAVVLPSVDNAVRGGTA